MTEQILTAYVEHVRTEHRELQALIHRARRALAIAARSLWREVTIPSLVEVLKDLHDHMERHFEQEETDGYLEEALIQAPRFTHQAECLLRQHPQMLKQMDEILAEVPRCHHRPDLWSQFELHAREMLQQLLTHEAAENQILERAYNTTLDVDFE